MGSPEASVESYVLITPARNEAAFVAGTIDSIVAQQQRPLKWVIVSDGSTDRTDAIVASYAARYDFIQLLRRSSGETRSFASKVGAFVQGYAEIAHLSFAFVGNLDGDVAVEPEYYARALERFAVDPRLGICSAIYWNQVGGELSRSRTRPSDTPGAAQLFRRQCYEEIGGYRALELGGEDTLAAAMARMNGWETRSFAEPKAIHRRLPGTADGRRLLRDRFQQGAVNYEWGAHPLFMIAKAFNRLDEHPPVLGSVALLGGYFSRWLRRSHPEAPDDVVRFVRREQLARLTSRLPWLRRGERVRTD
jgi:glycosyltransferase involved in cell wall biosynthesis